MTWLNFSYWICLIIFDLLLLVKLFRASQFIVSLNKYLGAVNNKFTVGMRFKMRFEGEDATERR